MRVFHDRLTTDEDRIYLKNLLSSHFEKLGQKKEEVLNKERIIFGDFFQGRDVEPRNYVETADLKSLIGKMEGFQEEYNTEASFGANK